MEMIRKFHSSLDYYSSVVKETCMDRRKISKATELIYPLVSNLLSIWALAKLNQEDSRAEAFVEFFVLSPIASRMYHNLLKIVPDFECELFLNDHNSNLIYKKKVVLIIDCTQDHNGALSHSYNFYSNVKKIEEQFSVAYQKGCDHLSVNACIERLKENNNKIISIWFRAHGFETQLGELPSKSIHLLKLDELEADATILLDACSTGKSISNNTDANFAQLMAVHAKGRVVCGARDDTSCLIINSIYPLKVSFYALSPNAILYFSIGFQLTNAIFSKWDLSVYHRHIDFPNSEFAYCEIQSSEEIEVLQIVNKNSNVIKKIIKIEESIRTEWEQDKVNFIKANFEE